MCFTIAFKNKRAAGAEAQFNAVLVSVFGECLPVCAVLCKTDSGDTIKAILFWVDDSLLAGYICQRRQDFIFCHGCCHADDYSIVDMHKTIIVVFYTMDIAAMPYIWYFLQQLGEWCIGHVPGLKRITRSLAN